jgi:hypothetical protein
LLCSWAVTFIVFVPIEVYAFAAQLLKAIWRIKKCNAHVVWEDEYVAEHMIVIIIPNIFIGKLNHTLFCNNIYDFEALVFQTSIR